MLKSYKAGFYIKTPRVSVIKCVKMVKNRGIFFIYVKTFYYFFQNFYMLIGGFEVHSLRYMQKKSFWKYSSGCNVCHQGRVTGNALS